MIRYVFIIAFLVSFNGLAQREMVDTANIDYTILNKYVLNAVNSERRKKKQDSVDIDLSLEKMTKDHVDYMAKNNYVGHDQKSRNKQFVQNRLVFYGGKHEVVLENVQSLDLRLLYKKSRGRLPYLKLGKLIVENWKKQSVYYKNLIHSKITGINQQYVFKDGFLYVCQVLASRQFEDNYAYQRGESILVKNKKECFNCKQVQKKINNGNGHIGWYSVSNDSIYYWNVKYYYKGKRKKNNTRMVFGRKGVVAIDVIHHEQIDCNGSTAYDRSIYNDGYYIGYVDKGMLYNSVHPSPEVYQVYVGQIPAFKDTFFQVDLYYSKKRKPCMNNSIIYVNPDYFAPKEYFNLPKPEIEKSNQLIVRDSVVIKIPFERNQTNEDTTIFQPLILALDSVTALNYKVKTVYYTGVASIEGNEKSNTKLIRKRGILVQNYLKKYYPEIEFVSRFYENFEDFRDGLGLIGHPEIAELSEDEMRAWANRNRDVPKVAELLNSTRQSSVSIQYQDEISLYNEAYSLSVQHVNDLIVDGDAVNANVFFQVLAHKAIAGDVDLKDSLLNMSIPQNNKFSQLNWYYFVFELNVKEENVTAERLNELFDIGAIKSDEEYLEYRLLFNIFNGNNAIKTDDFGEVLATVKRKRTLAWLEVLEFISGVQNYRYDSQMVGPMITNSALKNKFNVYQTYFVCQYLISWGYTVEPYLLLSKFARQKNLFPKLYKQYVKLGYFLQQFDNKREWKKIKVAMNTLASDHPSDFCDLFKWDQMGVRALENKEVAELFCKTCNE